MKIILQLLGIFTFLINSSYASNYPAVDVDMKVHKIAEHSYYVNGKAGIATDNAGFISNAGFVITKTGVVIIDALGSPSLAWKLLHNIRKITDKPITHVIVTHYHADHIYGLQVFKEQGAQIIAPQGSYDYLNSLSSVERLEERRFSLSPWVNDQTYLVKPDKIIDTKTDLKIGELTFELNYLGSAHSTGDLTIYVKEDNVLYSGDIIFEGRIPFVGDADTKVWLNTLINLDNTKLSALVPGHGAVSENPLDAIKLNREYLHFLRSQMLSAVENMQEFSTAYDQIDWSEYKDYPAFEGANRKNAYQVFLSLEKELLDE